jgi:hypothetical protein
MLYFLLLRTETLVSWVYKEKPEEPLIRLNFYSKDIVFLAIVLASAFSIFSTAPSYFVDVIQAFKPSEIHFSFLDKLTGNRSYFYQDTAQLAVSVVILLNASRVTGWVELYRKKANKNNSSEA